MKLNIKKIEKSLLVIMIFAVYVFNYQAGLRNTITNALIIIFCVFEIYITSKRNKIKYNKQIISFL